MDYKIFPRAKNKWLGAVLLLISVFAILIIFHRMAYYVYEYDPQFAPYDYGRFNFFSFFTVQSNIFVCIYLSCISLSLLGFEKADIIAHSSVAGALVTTYILITGAVYCCGIPLGFTPPFVWDTAGHSITSFIQVFHHMIVPPLMLVLWFFPMTNRKISYKGLWIFGIYPLAYSLFSIIRGAVGASHFYPYPFYRPDFIWELFFKDKPFSLVKGYALMLPVLIVGISLFIIIAAILIFIYNKRIEQTEKRLYVKSR